MVFTSCWEQLCIWYLLKRNLGRLISVEPTLTPESRSPTVRGVITHYSVSWFSLFYGKFKCNIWKSLVWGKLKKKRQQERLRNFSGRQIKNYNKPKKRQKRSIFFLRGGWFEWGFFRKRAFDEFNRKTRRRRRIEECSRMLIVGTDYTKTHKPKKEKLKRKENEHTKQTWASTHLLVFLPSLSDLQKHSHSCAHTYTQWSGWNQRVLAVWCSVPPVLSQHSPQLYDYTGVWQKHTVRDHRGAAWVCVSVCECVCARVRICVWLHACCPYVCLHAQLPCRSVCLCVWTCVHV